MTGVCTASRTINPPTLTAMATYELSQLPSARRCCWRAEAATILRLTARVHEMHGRAVVEAELATAPAARRLQAGILEGFGYASSLHVLPGSTPHSLKRYLVRVTQDAGALARQAGLIDRAGHPVRGLPRHVVTAICAAPCDSEAAWRGAFIAGGTLTARGGMSGLEVLCPDSIVALALAAAARRLGVHATAQDTRGTDRVLVKGRGRCTALLTRLGAHEAVATWDEDARNQAAVPSAQPAGGPYEGAAWNLDEANQSRSVQAAAAAAARAERALQILGHDAPPHLSAAGRLRIAHPMVNLPELGQLADPPLSKHALAGRIRRLLAMADCRAAGWGLPSTQACAAAAAEASTGRDHQ